MNTFDKVKQMIVDTVQCEENMVTPESAFKDDLDIDSLCLMELVMELEDEFGIKVENEEAKKIVTVSDLVNMIDSMVA